jgi:hypothetical protein
MRSFFALLLMAGCSNDDNMARPDLSAIPDLASSRDLQGSGCDPVAQDCGPGKKCTYVIEDPMDPQSGIIASCLDVQGSAGLGESCERLSPNGDPGEDTCAPGFFCTIFGWGGSIDDPDWHCNKLCSRTSDCPAEHHCIPRTEFAGDCVRDCGTLSSTSCGNGLTCSLPLEDIDSTTQTPILFLTCRQAGPGGVADACQDDRDCAAGLGCDFNEGTCSLQLCDDTKACPASTDMGLTCGSFTDNGSLGFCQ